MRKLLCWIGFHKFRCYERTHIRMGDKPAYVLMLECECCGCIDLEVREERQ